MMIVDVSVTLIARDLFVDREIFQEAGRSRLSGSTGSRTRNRTASASCQTITQSPRTSSRLIPKISSTTAIGWRVCRRL